MQISFPIWNTGSVNPTASKKKQARRDIFLGELDCITPWAALERSIAPFYPSSGGSVADWTDPHAVHVCLPAVLQLLRRSMENALYDSQAIRCFVGSTLPTTPRRVSLAWNLKRISELRQKSVQVD